MGGRRRRSGGRVEGASAGGIALVVVLWTLLLLSLIAAGFLAVKLQAREASNRTGDSPRGFWVAFVGDGRRILCLLPLPEGLVSASSRYLEYAA